MRSQIPREGMQTPWGRADHVYPEAEGIFFVGTPGHGGLKLRRDLNARMPDYMRRPGGWYEEDVEWSLPFVALEKYILATGTPRAVDTIQKGSHVHTFRNSYPDEYESFFRVALQPGESRKRDEQMFYLAHRNDLLAVVAWGDWKEGVPAGMVAVGATLGGDRRYPVRYFLIPTEEYHKPKDSPAFVVDPARYQEIPEP